jgi:hypothetical protein
MKNEPLKLTPVSNYDAPKIPTLADDNSAALKKLPARWQKNAKVIACIGLMGTLSLGGLTPLGASVSPATSVSVSQRDEIKVLLNGTQLEFDAPPMIVNNFTMVPFRAIFTALGMEVGWNSVHRNVFANDQGMTMIEISMESGNANVYGRFVEMPTPAIIHNGRVFVPLRFVAEATGAQVNWDAASRTVEITTTEISGYKLDVRFHGGGGGGTPFYVVHLTEQEISNILSEQIAAAGINLDSPPPEKIAVVTQEYYDLLDDGRQTFETHVPIDLFDSEKNIGIAKVGEWGGNFAKLAEKAFAEQFDDIVVGTIYNPSVPFDLSPWEGEPPTPEEVSEAGALAKENLAAQIQEFIAFLRAEGILE